MLAVNRIHNIDAIAGLRELDDESIDCVMTSPSYWATRDYGVSPTRWSDGTEAALGLEPTVEQYVAHLLEVFAEVKRVLKPSGTLWVNLGDTYAGSWGNYAPGGIKSRQREKSSERWKRPTHESTTFRPPSSFRQQVLRKSLCGAPERFVLGMLQQGWILRNRIVWHKTNYLPSSVKDRFTASCEFVFFFVKAEHYFFDLDAVRVPHKSPATIIHRSQNAPVAWRQSVHISGRRMPPKAGERQAFHPLGKNPGDCWRIAAHTKPLIPRHASSKITFRHPAVYPEELCERPILAGCPPRGLVLDPFMGSGTTALVARRLGRNFVGFEPNPEFVKLAEARLDLLGEARDRKRVRRR